MPSLQKKHTLTEQERRVLSTSEFIACQNPQNPLYEKGGGCNECVNGYAGRTAVVEFVALNTEIRDTLLHQNSFSSIQKILKKNGFRSMWEKGFELVKAGTISLEDLINTVGREENIDHDI